MTHGSGERGIALAAAVFVMVALAALLAGLWFAALQQYRVGANVVADRRAFDAAEAGLDRTVAGWRAAALNSLAVGDSAGFSGMERAGTGSWAGVVLRLGPRLFLVRSTGRAARGSSRRTLAVVVRLAPLALGIRTALAAAGPVRLGDGALVDATPAAADPTCTGAAGVILSDGAALTTPGCPGGGCLRGNPGSSVDTTLRGASVPLLGEAGWASLAAAADTVRAGGVLPPQSRVWLAPGDLTLPAGDLPGAAVLLVQGDLVVESGTRLTGLVVVRGRLIMRGAGGTIVGSVLAGSADLTAIPGAGAAVLYSGCAAAEALAAAAPARPLRERSWTAYYADGL